MHPQIGTTGDGKENSFCSVDGNVKQGATHRFLSRFNRSIFSTTPANTHQRRPSVFHNRPDVSEIDVDQAWYGYQFGNSLDTFTQNFIGHRESVDQGRFLINYLKNAIIGNSDDGINFRGQFIKPLLGNASTLSTFKGERLGDHSHG